MTRAEKKAYWNAQQRRPSQVRSTRAAFGKIRRRFMADHRDDPCWICGEPIDPKFKGSHPMAATIDHVKPLSRGGGNDPQNLRMAHARCNRAKGNLTPQEFKQALRDAAARGRNP